MTVAAVQSVSAAGRAGGPPPPPALSSVQQGDVAAGRAKVIEGRVFDVTAAGEPAGAPAIARWGDQPAGSVHRQTVEAVAARIGTDAPGEVAAEIERQLDSGGRERIVMDAGSKGDWPEELNARELKPDADYIVNGYHYATDGQGRVTSVEGTLDLQTAERNGYQQQVSGREDRLPDDQGGHLIASIFNGPGDRLNLVPMNGNLNTGAWKTVENRMADALKDGKSVEAKVEVVYGDGDSQRPDQFVITYRIDGGRPTVAEFDNVAGGKK